MNTLTFQIQKQFPCNPLITRRMGQVMNLFGMTLRRLEQLTPTHQLDLHLQPGQICCVTGPSGSGKSVLLREMAEAIPAYNRICLDEIPLENDRSVIDSVHGPLPVAIRMFNRVGLADVFALLQTPSLLSAGQQFRYRLFKAIISERPVIFADEFMASIEITTAMSICRQLRVLAIASQKIFIFAGVHDTFIPDLNPDVMVIKSAMRPTRVIWSDPQEKSETRNTKFETNSKCKI